ncbi:MAG TPA: SurA N-terminal domain-containing protein [Spirochaetota bacterium]|nr:SurA N-terminal domain-containing protein [Spirochaetota bacterium]HPV42086.1 SurA N-terminal domain-containing protein [Spirochaetota bacterium]
MFDSKSPIVKIVSYAVTGFFVMIIVISFGMPDFISRMGLDQTAIAYVNGEKVDRLDYLRYRDSRFGDMRGEKNMDAMILSYFINDVLLLQDARKAGFSVSDEAVKDYILNIPGLKDPATGTLNAERLNMFLERVNISFNDLQKTIRKDLLRDRYMQFLRMGVAVPSSEVISEYRAANSRIQVKYSYLSAMDMQKMFAAETAVTDAEIMAEMEKNKKEVKDPKTDRDRIKKKLESAKLARIKKDIIDRVNAIALKGGSFDEAQAVLKGNVTLSKIFRPGERLTDDRGQPVTGLNNSKIFLEDFMEIGQNKSSRIISSDSGMYIFTPVVKDIKNDDVPEKDQAAIAGRLEQESVRMITGNLMQKLYEGSKIVKNLKTD